jgi:hypothetical protein
MEQETTIYKDRAIWVGTALGGPLVAGYLAAANFRAFGERDKVWKTWLIAILATLFIFYIAAYAPYVERIPNMVFVLVYTGIAFLVVRIWQGAKIDAHIRAGGRVFSWLRVVVVAVVGGIVTASFILAFAFLNGEFSVTYKTYGIMKHDVQFDKSNITEAEVDKLAEAFTKAEYFDREVKKTVDMKKVGNNYEINIYCNDLIKTDPQATGWFVALRDDVQKFFPDNKIIFNLVIDTPDNVVKRLE